MMIYFQTPTSISWSFAIISNLIRVFQCSSCPLIRDHNIIDILLYFSFQFFQQSQGLSSSSQNSMTVSLTFITIPICDLLNIDASRFTNLVFLSFFLSLRLCCHNCMCPLSGAFLPSASWNTQSCFHVCSNCYSMACVYQWDWNIQHISLESTYISCLFSSLHVEVPQKHRR